MCVLIVGEGFIPPEVCTQPNDEQRPISAERGNLGTDKSVPYKSLALIRGEYVCFNGAF
ncbi:MAG: hypothetical protein FWG87_02640 [Defluviitaleaceae bacterium]|nr:hypothetical protein [Defluviitaleaceae bacterium]